MKLDEIAKLCEAASPGPWEDTQGPLVGRLVWADDGHTNITGSIEPDDARFIAASRTLLPRLLRVAEAAKNYTATFAGTMTNEAPTVTDLESLRITMRSLVAALADLEAEG